jgi:hypothetical protein
MAKVGNRESHAMTRRVLERSGLTRRKLMALGVASALEGCNTTGHCLLSSVPEDQKLAAAW